MLHPFLWKDANHAKKAAESMKITAPDLKKLKVIDEIIPEVKGGAHQDVDEQADEIEKVLVQFIERTYHNGSGRIS